MKKILAICSMIGLAIILISCGKQEGSSKLNGEESKQETKKDTDEFKDGKYDSGDIKGEYTKKDLGVDTNGSGIGKVISSDVDLTKDKDRGTDEVIDLIANFNDAENGLIYISYNGKIDEKNKTIDLKLEDSGENKGKIKYEVKKDGNVTLKGNPSLPWAKNQKEVTLKPKDDYTKEKYK